MGTLWNKGTQATSLVDEFTVGNDSSGCHNDYMNTFVDDFILFNHALTPEEVGKLRDYYGK